MEKISHQRHARNFWAGKRERAKRAVEQIDAECFQEIGRWPWQDKLSAVRRRSRQVVVRFGYHAHDQILLRREVADFGVRRGVREKNKEKLVRRFISNGAQKFQQRRLKPSVLATRLQVHQVHRDREPPRRALSPTS